MRNYSIEFLKIMILRIFPSLGLDPFHISGGPDNQWIIYRCVDACVGKGLYMTVVVGGSGE